MPGFYFFHIKNPSFLYMKFDLLAFCLHFVRIWCIISLLQHYYYALTKYPPHYKGTGECKGDFFVGLYIADSQNGNVPIGQSKTIEK